VPSLELAAIDWVVIAVYLVGIAALGLWIGRKVGDTEHYFLGARGFNKWIMIGQSFGNGTHADMPVSLAGAVSHTGLSGIWFQWKNMFATPFYWLMAPLYRRIGRTTMAELFEDRYGHWMGAFYMVFAMIYFTINMASMLKGAAKVISQAVGGHAPVNEIVIAMTVVFMVYSFIGGLVSSAWTDFFQGFLILTLSFLLIPLGWGEVGGLAGMKASLPAGMFSISTPSGIGVWFIFLLTVNGLTGITSQPHVMGMVATGKDEASCRAGFLYGTFVKRFCTLGWAAVGLMVAALLAQGRFGVTSLKEPEEAFGFACRHLLFPGGVGLMIASVLATNMAGCSAFMVDAGALFTKNFYGRYLVKGRPDRHYLHAGRFGGLLMAGAGVLYSVFLIDRVLSAFLLTETLASYVGISVLGGIFWRRATRWGALAGILTSMAVNFGSYAALGKRFDSWDPNVFLAALLSGTAAFVLFSLLTKPEDAADFFRRLETGEPLLIVNLMHPMRAARARGFFRTYRVDLEGFATGWALAIALVGAAWLIFH
jgi:Na+/proline symporter